MLTTRIDLPFRLLPASQHYQFLPQTTSANFNFINFFHDFYSLNFSSFSQGKTSAFFVTLMNHWLFLFSNFFFYSSFFQHICTKSVYSNKLLMKCHLEETWNWNDCFQLSCVGAFRSQRLASFHFFSSSTDSLDVYCFFLIFFFTLRSRLQFYFLNFSVSFLNTTARSGLLPQLFLMFTLIKFIGPQLRRVGILTSLYLVRYVSKPIPSMINRKPPPLPPQSQSARSGGWKSLVQLIQQHDFLRLKRTTFSIQEFATRNGLQHLAYSSSVTVLFLAFWLLRKCRSHLSRIYFVAALPQYARRGIFWFTQTPPPP